MHEMEELGNQVQKLESSQEFLRDALLDSPQDQDFLSALAENETAIKRRRERILLIHEELMIRDPAYRQEMQKTGSGILPAGIDRGMTTSVVVTGPVESSRMDTSIAAEDEEKTEFSTEGMFL